MINKKIGFILAIVLIFLLIGIPMLLFKHKKPAQEATVVTGLTEGQQKTFQQDLSGAMAQYGYIKKGNTLLAAGRYDDAIKEYETALSLARSTGSRGEAFISLANAYEKKRDYKKALEYMLLVEKMYVSNWAKHPIFERIKYLEYILKGEYDLAIKHAELAIEEGIKIDISSRQKKPRADYVERLNDLKAAKDYILSLKKK